MFLAVSAVILGIFGLMLVGFYLAKYLNVEETITTLDEGFPKESNNEITKPIIEPIKTELPSKKKSQTKNIVYKLKKEPILLPASSTNIDSLPILWREKSRYSKIPKKSQSSTIDTQFMNMLKPNDEFSVQPISKKTSPLDPLFPQVARAVVQYGKAYIWYIQREFNISYDRALMLIYQLENNNIVQGLKGDVLIKTIEELNIRLKDLNMPEVQLETSDERNERLKTAIVEKLKDQKERRDFEKKVRKQLETEGVIDKSPKRPPIPREVVDAVYSRDGGRCVYCGSTDNLQLDHIIPFSKGGATTLENLQLLCQKCNLEKSNKIG